MRRGAIERVGRRLLDDLAEIHDIRAAGRLAHQREIMRDEKNWRGRDRAGDRGTGSSPVPASPAELAHENNIFAALDLPSFEIVAIGGRPLR